MLFARKRLLILSTVLLFVAGYSSLGLMPNSEDPSLTQRNGAVVTTFPGATAERVDALISSVIEDALFTLDDVDSVSATSRAGLSIIGVQLEDSVGRNRADEVWTRVRSKLSEVSVQLPASASEPSLEDDVAGSSSIIVALTWKHDSEPLMGILQRYAHELEDILLLTPNTEKTSMRGDSEEEVLIEVEPDKLAGLGLTVGELATLIKGRDSKEPAGRLRGGEAEIGIEVAGGFFSLDRLREIPIQTSSTGTSIRLNDIANIKKGIVDPPRSVAIINGERSIVVSARMRFTARIEQWTDTVLQRLDRFDASLPEGIEMEILFQQNEYTLDRLNSLKNSLVLGVFLVILSNYFLMGVRSSLIVSAAIPTTILFALVFMNLFGLALHQMSVIGFICALGMMIDNAVIMIDEIQHQSKAGNSINGAIKKSASHLWAPLLASTLTSVLAFLPLGLMPGPVGEFNRAMAITVIICLLCSYVLAMSWIPAMYGQLHKLSEKINVPWLRYSGLSSTALLPRYQRFLERCLLHPRKSLLAVVALSFLGVSLGASLDQELFPNSDRNQFPIQIELPHSASTETTLAATKIATDALLSNPDVTDVYWFLGAGFPTFYYSLYSDSSTAPNMANALVVLEKGTDIVTTINETQQVMDNLLPQAQAIVWQMGQGSNPFAPIAFTIKGPDLVQLSELAEQLRARLSAIPHIKHTRSTLNDGKGKFVFEMDEASAFAANLNNDDVARQLSDALEGVYAGALLEDTEEVPIRVRVPNSVRSEIGQLNSIELKPQQIAQEAVNGPNWIPLSALGRMRLVPELSEINRLDGERSATVQGFITQGILPSVVYSAFELELGEFANSLPAGYRLDIEGEAEARGDAFGSLLTYLGLILIVMVSVIVVSIRSFRGTLILMAVAVLSLGYGMAALWVSGYAFGFSAILGLVALIGISINDSIVVHSAIKADPDAAKGDIGAIKSVVVRATRHVLATSITTMAGFLPLLFSASNIWPPMAVTIGFGVAGATILALFFTPCAYILLNKIEIIDLNDNSDESSSYSNMKPA